MLVDWDAQEELKGELWDIPIHKAFEKHLKDTYLEIGLGSISRKLLGQSPYEAYQSQFNIRKMKQDEAFSNFIEEMYHSLPLRGSMLSA